jgi:hypothetical protein
MKRIREDIRDAEQAVWGLPEAGAEETEDDD